GGQEVSQEGREEKVADFPTEKRQHSRGTLQAFPSVFMRVFAIRSAPPIVCLLLCSTPVPCVSRESAKM
ncbi:MAG TPA: hypothetical protein VMD55_02065, partial [Terracidiphilus sp.]|nr:hypothetical protein [Terracidiphilus sp.]